MFAVPLKLVPLILRAVASLVAEAALPFRLPLNVGAVTALLTVRLPLPARSANCPPRVFSKMKSVFCSSNQIQISYDTGNLITDYNQDLIDKLKEQNIEFNDKKKLVNNMNSCPRTNLFIMVIPAVYTLIIKLFAIISFCIIIPVRINLWGDSGWGAGKKSTYSIE